MAYDDLDEETRTRLEAAAFRRLLAHLARRTDAQNIDLMNLAGFCRNCLSNWLAEAAAAEEIDLSREDVRGFVYGMPHDEWKARYQTEASPAQKDAFKEAFKNHG